LPSINRKTLSFIALIIFLLPSLAACQPGGGVGMNPTRAAVDIGQVASAQEVAGQFLTAWADEDYETMYGLLSSLSRDAIPLTDFAEQYSDFANTITLQSLEAQVLSAIADGDYAQVAYRAVYHTLLVGELTREPVMSLVWENRAWRIQWEVGLILPELADSSRLELVYDIPDRGRIFDHNGAPLAGYENAITLGLVPGEILPEQAQLVYDTLAEISAFSADELAETVARTPDDWYLPVVTLSRDEIAPHLDALRSLNGVQIEEFRTRSYLEGGIAPHALGYQLFIPEDEMDTYARLGYRQDEQIGAAGLEGIYETELAGQRGGSLYLLGPDGEITNLLASGAAVAGDSIVTTLDRDLQLKIQQSLGDLRAAVVVMEVDSGRILAMASNPGFDPNVFDADSMDSELLTAYFSDEDQPLFNRVTQGQYPPGSIFKIISMAAALENGIYTQYSSYNCQHAYWTCDSVYLYDWTYSHGVSSSGVLSLPEGLMRSCNPWFYRIGETLYSEGYESALSDMAVGFGLGAETGIELPEASGNIPETAANCVTSSQMAIGQGEILVTPLQIVNFISALANGGTLYRPSLVEEIDPLTGDPIQVFEPEAIGELPISEQTREIVLDAMRLVVEDGRGTANWALRNLDIAISGKTGTAQTPSGNSHAWFAGFTREADPEHPDIAVVVLVENGGEGSEMAAPVFGRVVSLYFSDGTDPGDTLLWEDAPFVPSEPEPTPTIEVDSPDGE
jgi:penicillin-binding protein 2